MSCPRCGADDWYVWRGQRKCRPCRTQAAYRSRKRRDRRAESRRRYARVRERTITQATAWNRAHPDRRRETLARHAQTPGAQRRVELRRAMLTTACMEYAAILLLDPCCYCGAPMDEIDHIVPVASGGASQPDNLTSACRCCNRRKNAKPLLLFLLLHVT